MIHATKAEVDQARATLADHLEELAYRIQMWRNKPTEAGRLRDARYALDQADDAFEEYERVLTTWAAGPDGGDRG